LKHVANLFNKQLVLDWLFQKLIIEYSVAQPDEFYQSSHTPGSAKHFAFLHCSLRQDTVQLITFQNEALDWTLSKKFLEVISAQLRHKMVPETGSGGIKGCKEENDLASFSIDLLKNKF